MNCSLTVDAIGTPVFRLEGDVSERRPLALIRHSGVRFSSRQSYGAELRIAPQDDLYLPLLNGKT